MAGRHSGPRDALGAIRRPYIGLERAADVAGWGVMLASLAGLLCSLLWSADALVWFIGVVFLLEFGRRLLAWLAEQQDAADRRP